MSSTFLALEAESCVLKLYKQVELCLLCRGRCRRRAPVYECHFKEGKKAQKSEAGEVNREKAGVTTRHVKSPKTNSAGKYHNETIPYMLI